MKFKNIIIVAAMLLPIVSQAQNGYTLTGKVGNLESPAKAYLRYGSTIDSTEIRNGYFEFTGKVTSPLAAVVSIRHKADDPIIARLTDYQRFYLENSPIRFNPADSIKKATLEGSLLNFENQKLIAQLKPTKDSITAMTKKWTNVKRDESNAAEFDLAATEFKRLLAEAQEISNAFIEAHPNSYISLVTFSTTNLGYNFDPVFAENIFNKLNEELRVSALGVQTKKTIELNKKTMIGVEAQNFTQNNENDKPVSLADFRGKYVLVDFWASWCAPCRAENPNLVKAYTNLKDRNFEIIGVSLDDSKAAWLNAIEKDGLPWVQVSDLKGWKNDIALQFGISAVPQNMLVNPEGVIIAKNIRGEELYEKLEELLK